MAWDAPVVVNPARSHHALESEGQFHFFGKI
jgi:hypothetical protein